VQERYLKIASYDLKFNALQYRRMYKEATTFGVKYYGMDELVSHCGFSMPEYANTYHIFVIDTSKQPETLAGNCSNITVDIIFNTPIPENVNISAFAIYISD